MNHLPIEATTPCANDPAPFFPARHDPIWREAVEACSRCGMRDQCLEEAITYEWGLGRNQRMGIYGGLTPGRRFDLEQQRRQEDVA